MACASIFGFAWHYSHIIMTGAYNSLIHSVVNTFGFYAFAAAGLILQIERRSSRSCTLYSFTGRLRACHISKQIYVSALSIFPYFLGNLFAIRQCMTHLLINEHFCSTGISVFVPYIYLHRMYITQTRTHTSTHKIPNINILSRRN